MTTSAATEGKTTSKGSALSRPDPVEAADGLLWNPTSDIKQIDTEIGPYAERFDSSVYQVLSLKSLITFNHLQRSEPERPFFLR